MDPSDLKQRLAAGEIVPLTAAEWDRLSGDFEIVETRDTGVAGQLLLARGSSGLVAVERPEPGRRVVRPLADEAQAREFVRQRLETYDRMWDGCGCKIDYLH